MAKAAAGTYEEDKRSLIKVKHRHSVDVVVAGYRVHKSGDGVGSMMLGLYDQPEGAASASLQHVGVASAFKATQRVELAELLEPHRLREHEPHPWTEWADPERHADGGVRMPGAPNRWSAKRDHSWVPLRPELVAEVVVEQLTKGRFRHPARFQRWRPDRDPRSCTYDQVAIAAPAELFELFPEAPTP
jgi:ATP-dependent DNA ligase